MAMAVSDQQLLNREIYLLYYRATRSTIDLRAERQTTHLLIHDSRNHNLSQSVVSRVLLLTYLLLLESCLSGHRFFNTRTTHSRFCTRPHVEPGRSTAGGTIIHLKDPNQAVMMMLLLLLGEHIHM
jgi:hypothetical protein